MAAKFWLCCLACCLLLSGCGVSEARLQEVYENGLEAGEAEGYQTGYAAALADLDTSQAQYYSNGYEAGYATGYAAGLLAQAGNETAETSTEAEPTEAVQETASAQDGALVYVTKSGSKYHEAGCSSLTSSQLALTLAEALAQGYTPCSKCH